MSEGPRRVVLLYGALFFAGAFVLVGTYNGATYDLEAGTQDYFTLRPLAFDPFAHSLRASVRANVSVTLAIESDRAPALSADGIRANLSTSVVGGEVLRVFATAPQGVKGTLTVIVIAPLFFIFGGVLIAASIVVYAWDRRRRPSTANA